MVEIRHKVTGEVLHTVSAESLQAANLRATDLREADLREADLRRAGLVKANLTRADLQRGKLRRARLGGADLTSAQLPHADLRGADLRGARLTAANLTGADLSGADLSGAIAVSAVMRGADLYGANLTEVDLRGSDLRAATLFAANLTRASLHCAQFAGSRWWETTIFQSLGLGEAVGLDTATHWGPSSVDVRSVRTIGPRVADTFLLGIGLDAEEIQFHRARAAKRQFYTVFVSSASSDASFVNKLVDRLKASGVDTFHYADDRRVGEEFRPLLEREIQARDRMLAVCSEHAFRSRWVAWELSVAAAASDGDHNTRLFPIDLDGSLRPKRAACLAAERVAMGEWSEDWLSAARGVTYLSFQGWETEATFEASVQELLAALHRPAAEGTDTTPTEGA